ncbi:ninjurin-1-like [Micropterus dolomieu]|uniref:ninjurin-1-like n=1 Tax=Micropterus dolomieu TaxID=147949 RepID=UPI001E8E422C|nr:ninjurin-1-like [Micropterus dolomieu]
MFVSFRSICWWIVKEPGCRRLNVNHYATKKTVAQSMLDVALLMANSSQLKAVIFVGPHYQFYYPVIVLLSMSIMLQVMVGLLLIFIVKYDLNNIRKQSKLNMMNNIVTVLVFFTVIINIFTTALGFEGLAVRSPEMLIPETQFSLPPTDFNMTDIH